MNDLKIEYVPIDSIKPYENNAKLHPQAQIEQIKASMLEFGNIDPIGVWHDEIVEGHGRHIAAKELGFETIPIIRLDSLTDEQRRAYALAHNKLTMNSGFDFEKLEEELNSLSFDMAEFGFNDATQIDWDRVEDLNEDNYEEPEHEMLECPACHHIDRKIHFKKVEE